MALHILADYKKIPAFYFDADRLSSIASENKESFQQAVPYKHIVLDDFLPADIVDLLIEEFPSVDDIAWDYWGPGMTRSVNKKKLDKLGQSNEIFFGPLTRHFMSQLNSGPFIHFLEELTGFGNLIPDPTYNKCGLHSTGKGGRLMIHTDTNRHPHSGHRLHQILNLIIFLNEDWEEAYGGHLELWSEERVPCKKILPVANRAVLFYTSARSFHGHPEPLNCPPDRRRNSLALYYYVLDRPDSDDYAGKMQAVQWIPTHQDDFDTQGDLIEKTNQLLLSISGQTFRVRVNLLPFSLKDISIKCLSLCFFDWDKLTCALKDSVLELFPSLAENKNSSSMSALPGDMKPVAFLLLDEKDKINNACGLLMLSEDGIFRILRRDSDYQYFFGDLTYLLYVINEMPCST